jgi:hypothetical protein
VRGGDRHALGAVDGGAAADGHQAVAALRLVDRRGRAHGRLRRVGRGLVVDRVRNALQRIQRLLQHAGRLHARVRHDQGFADADALAFLLEQLDRAEIELDLGHVVDEGHGVASLTMESRTVSQPPAAAQPPA